MRHRAVIMNSLDAAEANGVIDAVAPELILEVLLDIRDLLQRLQPPNYTIAQSEVRSMTKDYEVKAAGRRILQLNKQDDGTYQVKVFLKGPDKTLATLVIEQAEMEKLANYSAGLLKK